MTPTVTQLRITNVVLLGVALAVTAFRLYIRYTRSKLWWDDLWVFVSSIFVIGLMVVNFLHTANPADYPQVSKIAVYYMCIQFYYAVSWYVFHTDTSRGITLTENSRTSRLSILFTVIRITFEKMRRFLVFSAFGFLIAWAVLFAQVFWVCGTGDQTWRSQPDPQCSLGLEVAVTQIVCVVVSDAILIFAPIKLVLGVRLPKVTKIRVVSVFASTLIATGVSLYYIYALLRIGGITEEWSATIHDGVSLLVANLTVVVAFFFRVFGTLPEGTDESCHENTCPLHHVVRNRKPENTFNLSMAVATARVEDIERPRHALAAPSETTLWKNDAKTLKLHNLPPLATDLEILAMDK